MKVRESAPARKWAKKEDKFLKRNWRKKQVGKIAAELDRSETAVKLRARQILYMKPVYHKWLTWEDELLMHFWGTMPVAKLAKSYYK